MSDDTEGFVVGYIIGYAFAPFIVLGVLLAIDRLLTLKRRVLC